MLNYQHLCRWTGSQQTAGCAHLHLGVTKPCEARSHSFSKRMHASGDMTTEANAETTWDNSTARAPLLHSGAAPPLHTGTASSATGAPTHVSAEAAGATSLRRRWPARHAHAHEVRPREAPGAAICCAALGSRQIRVSWQRVTWSIESKQRGGGRRPAAAAATAASGTLPAATLPARRLFGRVSVPHWPTALLGDPLRVAVCVPARSRGPLRQSGRLCLGACTQGARGRRPGSLHLAERAPAARGAFTFRTT